MQLNRNLTCELLIKIYNVRHLIIREAALIFGHKSILVLSQRVNGTSLKWFIYSNYISVLSNFREIGKNNRDI